MPSLKELNKFRNDLRNIGGEMQVTAEWGERFEEYPFPEKAPVPELNVDDLLGSIDIEPEKNDAPPAELAPESETAGSSVQDILPPLEEVSHEPADGGNISFEDITTFPPAGTFAMPSDTGNDIGSGYDGEDIFQSNDESYNDSAGTENKEDKIENRDASDNFESNFAFDVPLAETGEEVSLFDESLDFEEDAGPDINEKENVSGEPAPANLRGDKKNSFDNMISDLDLDSASEISESDNGSPDLPEELLSGFSGLVEEARKDKSEDEDIEDFPQSDFSGFSFPDSNGRTAGTELEELNEENAADEIEELSSADGGFGAGFSSSQDDSFSGFEENGAEAIPLYEDGSGSAAEPEDLSGVDDFGSAESDGLSFSGDAGEKEELRGMEMMDGVEIPDIDVSEMGSHTGFAIGDDILSERIEESGDSDFTIPEDFSKFSAENNFNYKPKTEAENAAAGTAEAIPLSISADDYEYLVDRIASFPLNVRLEIEDYLANGKDTEISKMEIVNFIITNVPLKKIVAKLEDTLGKTIPVPKGFERKSVEDYELEKKGFKYKFFRKILPAAVLTSLILLLAFCLGVLTWQFIYKPAVSENIYKQGFSLIDESEYGGAIKQFDLAGSYKKKKKWYFKYANEFRNKKQFNSAEEIYKRLLFDFNRDKQGGIEYSEMLSKDLHNYEKAEHVLKRGVLDYHINDEQAMLSLADMYLEWAYEDPSKYGKAKENYSSLIKMYGRKDPFLSGMMKYFIRTDNLAEVLPLKEHFMNKRAKISLNDFTELGGYLLEKRYEPKPSDSDNLRERIDDLREILERAIKRDSSNAEANYNMGKFFIHNRKPEAAEFYLSQAIKIYEDEIGMTPLRIMKNMDAMRLYGEILSGNKEFLKAQEIFANALAKYKDYSSLRILPPNEIIGKLYADYADINYFISGDMDSALNAYTQAVNEMNNTPSIHYRIGYIHYQKGNYIDAMRSMTRVYSEKPDDRNLLYGFGNVLYKRGSYYAAQAYYERLMEMLEAEKIRKGFIMPQIRPDHTEFVEEYMKASNNLGVILNKLAVQSGSSEKNGRALALFGDSVRAWDSLTRNPQTMISSKSVGLAYLNIQNIIKPISTFESEIYSDIPKTLQNEKILQQKDDR